MGSNRVAERLMSFRVYSHEEEEEEKFLGVSTKLKLFDDPWKIRKVLKESVYSHEEEEEEKFLGVSTKLKLFDDPWKIRKVLKESDCNRLCRLMLAKDLVKKNIIDVWNQVGFTDDAQISSIEGVGVKVWDYDRDKEYKLTFKQLPSSKCYVFGHNWRPKFVKERRLKRGDEIGMYWSKKHSKFVISVLARGTAAK